MEALQIKSGISEVIASGTVISFEENPIEITFGPPGEQLKLILVFQDKEGEQAPHITREVIDIETMLMTLTNFGSVLGTGTTKPMPVGIMAKRRLYFHFRVYTLQDSDKTVHYTFYLGEEVNQDE